MLRPLALSGQQSLAQADVPATERHGHKQAAQAGKLEPRPNIARSGQIRETAQEGRIPVGDPIQGSVKLVRVGVRAQRKTALRQEIAELPCREAAQVSLVFEEEAPLAIAIEAVIPQGA